MEKYSYQVFFDESKVVLEIDRTKFFSIYIIEEDGTSEFLENRTTPYIPSNKLPADPYFIDRVEGPVMHTIDFLTTKINFDALIGRLTYLVDVFDKRNYKKEDFSMDMAYLFTDYTDSLKQTARLLEEPELEASADKIYKFCDVHFYSRTEDLTEKDFVEIKKFWEEQIQLLQTLKSH